MAERVEILRIEVDQETAKKELIATEQALSKLREEQKQYRKELKDSNGTNKKAAEGLANVSIQIQKATKNRRELTKAVQAEKGSLNDLRAQLARMVQQRNKINISTRQGRREFDLLNKQIRKHNDVIKRAEAAGGDFRRNVGNYPKIFSAATARLAGLVGGFFAFIRVIKSAAATVKNYQAAQANLSAILGKTREETQGLTEDSLRYGRATTFTATQVTELQTELAKLGFTMDEIEAATPAVLSLAEATGADLASAAKVSGAALRAFGLDATETERVTSVLAVATTKSALSFGDYETALSTVAPVAKAYGFTIEETVALLGKLRDAGFDASSAATATRNIILNLADSSGALAQSLGGSVRNFDELIPALGKLRDSGVDLNTTLQLTDKRSVAAFQQFLNGAESAGELAGSLVGVNDELQNMVDVKLDTIAGDTAKLASAWEGLILQVEGGEGALGKSARFLIQSATAMLQFATNIDLAFKREKKLVEQDFDRIIDELNAFTTESGKLISDVLEGFDKMTEGLSQDELLAFGEKAVEILEQEGESAIVAAGIWEAYLRKHTQELEETVAREEAVKQAAADAEEKRLQELAFKENEIRIKQAEKLWEEIDKVRKDRAKLLDENQLEQPEFTAEELQQQIDEEQQRQRELRDEQLQHISRFYDDDLLFHRQAEIAKTKAAKDAAAQRIEIARMERDINIAYTGVIAGAISGLLRETSSEYKFFKSAESLIAAYTAINQIWADASLPSFFAKLAASIFVGAQTLGNVAKINQIGFASGGRIGNRGIPVSPDSKGDNRLILARDDEVILNSRQQARIGARQLKAAGVPAFADGGMVGAISQPIMDNADQIGSLDRTMKNLPPVWVSVRDINQKQAQVVTKEKISRL
jgi:TP901 family phage tail tape measure protein